MDAVEDSLDTQAHGLPDHEIVRENDRVLLVAQDGSNSLNWVRSGTRVKCCKHRVRVEPIIGVPYGSVFRVVKEKLVRVSSSYVDAGSELTDPSFTPCANNSKLNDVKGNQMMQQKEIEDIKQNMSGEALIEALKKHSKTFAMKSEFSQEKWLKKKRRQHIIEVRVVRPTALSLSSSYLLKKPDKILNMRPDTLATILLRANLRPYSQVLVLDEATGLVTGAIVERLNGYGRILAPFQGDSGPSADCLRSLNLPLDVLNTVHHFKVREIGNALRLLRRQETGASGDTFRETADAMSSVDDVSTKTPLSESGLTDAFLISKFEATESQQSANGRIKASSEQIQAWLAMQSDSLVICSQTCPIHNVKTMWPLLVAGGSLVVYYRTMEPLSRLCDWLKRQKVAASVQQSENFYRELQVLPNRTHPINNMVGAGGFVLSAIKLANAEMHE